MRLLPFLLIAVFAHSSAAVAQAAGSSETRNELRLGLERLHWGMTAGEARAAYPDMQNFDPLVPAQPPAPGVYTLHHHGIAGCDFTVRMAFPLNMISLSSNGDAAPCVLQIRQMLVEQYGDPRVNPYGAALGESLTWAGLDLTYVSIDYGYNSQTHALGIHLSKQGDFVMNSGARIRLARIR